MKTYMLLIPYMAITSRLCGAKSFLPFGLEQWLYAAPYSVVTFIALLPTVMSWHIWALSALAGATALIGKRLGHGRGISIGEPMKPGSKPEKVELLILWLQPHIPNWLYKSLILLLCEAVVWAGMAIAVSPWLMLASMGRPVGYLIGWYGQRLVKSTMAGEILTGAFAGAIFSSPLFCYMSFN